MKLIPINFGFNLMGYPVGLHMKDAIDYINKVGENIELPCNKTDNITIWCRGSSGAILASLLLVKLTGGLGYNYVNILHVKKPGESSHSQTYCNPNSDYNIIIDDFVSSGETIRSIAAYMNVFNIEFIDCLIVHSAGVNYTKENKLYLNLPTPKLLITKEYDSPIRRSLRALKPSNLKKYRYDNKE